jgi:hypothetical protein
MRRPLLAIGLTMLVLATVTQAAEAAPFITRYAGTNTAIAVDMGSIGRGGAVRTGWTYVFFRSNRLMTKRLEILATREAVNCTTRSEKALATVGYMASGAEISRAGPDPAWTIHLRGSNTDLIISALCEGRDPEWTLLRLPNVFAVYRAVWR